MNIQPGKLKQQRRSAQTAKTSLGVRLAAVLKIIVVFAMIAVFCNISIYLNQKITETDRAIRKTEQEIKRTEREIAQLRIRREQLSSWEYIGARIAYFKLGLREPAPGQVGRMALLSPRQAQMVPLESVASARRPSNAGRRN
ncbi:hypothetical protein [uncultured Victivallis sp.]|uniref:hypothetical protein n=1 Tax=uncultured Victivallis sp. TaxID=354118 RepID=UPI0025F87695|nr:hypothetical protein [uncultured Victivallis sp.]